jgi:transcriptional regulator with XRE-family HTH domain
MGSLRGDDGDTPTYWADSMLLRARNNGGVAPSPQQSPESRIGIRVRSERSRRQVSQAQLAAEMGISGSYLSLIESSRRPVTPELLQRLAAALDCSVEYLRTGRGAPDDGQVELDLRFAEMALRAGDAEAARERFSKVAASASDRGLHDVQFDGRWGLARATEAMGSLESAIAEYETLAGEHELPATVERTVVLTALCRGYHEAGDLARAVDVGETALQALEDSTSSAPLDDAGISLASTLVGCYFERGDLTRAHLLAERTLARADENGSPQARGAALWNAGLVSEARGDLRMARLYVERALALYSETDTARRTALLRVALAWLLLRDDVPQLPQAEALLERALEDLPVVGSPLDIAYAETEQARCHLLRGDCGAALDLAEAVVNRLARAGRRLESARARLVLGDAQLVAGDIDAAVKSFTEAAADLHASGAQRQAASAWRELAESLVGVGRTSEALDAYRAASDAVGVPAPASVLDRIKDSKSGDLAAEARNPRRRQPSRR